MPDARSRRAVPRARQSATEEAAPRAGGARLPATTGIGNRALVQLQAADDQHAVRALTALSLGAGNHAAQALARPASGGTTAQGVVQRKPTATSLTTPGLGGSTMGSAVDARLEAGAASIRDAQVRQQRAENQVASASESAAATTNLQMRIYIGEQAGPLVERIVLLEVDAQGANFDRPRVDRDEIRQRWAPAVQSLLAAGGSLQEARRAVASINRVLNSTQRAGDRLESLENLF